MDRHRQIEQGDSWMSTLLCPYRAYKYSQIKISTERKKIKIKKKTTKDHYIPTWTTIHHGQYDSPYEYGCHNNDRYHYSTWGSLSEKQHFIIDNPLNVILLISSMKMTQIRQKAPYLQIDIVKILNNKQRVKLFKNTKQFKIKTDIVIQYLELSFLNII